MGMKPYRTPPDCRAALSKPKINVYKQASHSKAFALASFHPLGSYSSGFFSTACHIHVCRTSPPVQFASEGVQNLWTLVTACNNCFVIPLYHILLLRKHSVVIFKHYQ